MNKTLQYHAQNKAEHDSVLFLLEKYGFSDSGDSAASYIAQHGFNYPWMVIHLGYKTFAGNKTPVAAYKTVTLSELLLALNNMKNQFDFALNGEYKAQIVEGQDFVTVGCQKIEVKKIVDLVAKLEEMGCLPLTND
jgi:hypothetical protein